MERMKQIGPRIRIEHGVDGHEVHVRAARKVGALVVLPIWLVAWTIAGFVVIDRLQCLDQKLFAGLWLFGWLAGEVFAVVIICWAVFGEEVVAIRKGMLTVAKQVGPFTLRRSYPFRVTSEISVVKLCEPPLGFLDTPSSFSDITRHWGLSGGTLAFDHNGKSVRFGMGLTEQEARQIVDELIPQKRKAGGQQEHR